MNSENVGMPSSMKIAPILPQCRTPGKKWTRYAGKRVENQAIDDSRKDDEGDYSYRVAEIKQSGVPYIGNCYRHRRHQHFAGEFIEERGLTYTPERCSVKACLRMRGFGVIIPRLWGPTLVTW